MKRNGSNPGKQSSAPGSQKIKNMENWLKTVNIRLLREDDLPELEWGDEYRRYRRIYREIFRNSQKGLSIPLVAETSGDGIIGQVFLSQKEPNANYGIRTRYYFLSSFRIKPDFRDLGLGDRMIRMCFQEVRNHRLRDIFLNCSADNDRARHFYEKHGFRIVRLDEGKWSYVNHEGLVVSEKESAYLMRKTFPRFFFK